MKGEGMHNINKELCIKSLLLLCFLYSGIACSQEEVRIDLGCGTKKTLGFIGVDRYKLPGVDVVADLERLLPFKDNSVDVIYTSHFLEHIKDLTNMMKEIYRVGKHGAQLVILVPYYNQHANFANPYHVSNFNEHTPRFWTNSPTNKYVRNEIWAHPHAGAWGLASSDNSNPGLDIRCVDLEFFYFDEYRHLAEKEKLYSRKRYTDVCDQIMYKCIILKQPTTDDDFDAIVQRTEFFEPDYVKSRRTWDSPDKSHKILHKIMAKVKMAWHRLISR